MTLICSGRPSIPFSHSLDDARRPGARADELPKGRDEDFAAYCGQCLEAIHRARRGFRRDAACPELAWHRARLGTVLTSDVQIGRMLVMFGSGPVPAGFLDKESLWRAAVRAKVTRRDRLSPEEPRAEATIRRRLTSNNLSELRWRTPP